MAHGSSRGALGLRPAVRRGDAEIAGGERACRRDLVLNGSDTHSCRSNPAANAGDPQSWLSFHQQTPDQSQPFPSNFFTNLARKYPKPQQPKLVILIDAILFAKLDRREFKVGGDSVGIVFSQVDVTSHGAALRAFRLALEPEVKFADLDELAHCGTHIRSGVEAAWK